jgi:two-component system, NarL family, sensor kinase
MCKAFVKSSYFLNVLLVFGLLQYTTAIKANSKADELKKLQQKLKEAISDTARITTLIDISWYYLYINTDSALTYAKNAYKLSKLPTNIINSASALGVTYSKKGDFENSVKYNLEAFHYAQKIHDKGNYSCLLNDIGSNYFMLDDLEKALKYFTSALEFSHDLETTYVALFNLGQIYAVKGNFTEAYGYFEKALKVAEKENKTKRIALIYNRIGELFLDKKNYPKSLYYFDRSLNMLGTDEFYYRISCLRGKSYSNLGTGRYAIALKTALQADTLASKGAFVNALSDIDLLISQIYDSLRNPSKSKVYFKRYAAIKDSMFNTEKNERITFLQTKFENKQHEMEAQQLKQQAGFHRKMSYVYLIIGISLLIVLFYIIKNIRQTNKILHFEKVILTQQQENERLEKQNLRLKLDEKHREILTHAFQIQQQKEVLLIGA